MALGEEETAPEEFKSAKRKFHINCYYPTSFFAFSMDLG
jgi:hypothetical protein